MSLFPLKRTKQRSSNSKRAAILAALFFPLAVGPVCAAKTESHLDIISKAQNLVLQQDRKQAQNLLLAALKKEKKPAAIEEVRQSLRELSSAFLSDKTQQLYESSLGSFFSDLSASQNALAEAKKNEPENIEIRQLEVLQLIRANQCEAAKTELDKLIQFLPYFEELRLLKSRQDLCLGDFSSAEKSLQGLDLKKTPLAVFWMSAMMELQFKRGQFSKALDLVKIKPSPRPEQLPELAYWQFKSERELKLRAEVIAQRYLSLCKNIGTRQKRELLLEPLLCTRVPEVEAFLKKANNPEI